MLAAVVGAMPLLWPQTSGANGQTRIFVEESTSWSVAGEDVATTEREAVLCRAVPSRRLPRS